MSSLSRSFEELEGLRAALPASPCERGSVALIVQRPVEGERATPQKVALSVAGGMAGDRWASDAGRELERQLTLMQAGYADLVAVDPARRALCGDNFLVDFDLSESNAPVGTQLQLGEATLEVTEAPHLGCAKFRARFGDGALKWVNLKSLLPLRLRGINARVLVPGEVSVGAPLVKLSP